MKFSRMMFLALSLVTTLGCVYAMEESAPAATEQAAEVEAPAPAEVPAPEAAPMPEAPAPMPEAAPAPEAAPSSDSEASSEASTDDDMDQFFKDLMLDDSEDKSDNSDMN